MRGWNSKLYWKTIAAFAAWFAVTLSGVFLAISTKTTPSTESLLGIWLCGTVCCGVTLWPLFHRLQHVLEKLNGPARQASEPDEIEALTSGVQSLKQANERLRDSEPATTTAVDERLLAMMAAMQVGVISIDNEERIVFSNTAAARLLGADKKTMTGRLLFEAIRNSYLVDSARSALKDGEAGTVEFSYSRTGAILSVDVAPIATGGLVLSIDDVSELRRVETARRDFVSAVSHELKTPLTVIQACTETLLSGAMSDPDAAERFLNRIELQSERLLELIVGMLQLARLEVGKEVFQKEIVDLAEVSRRVASTMAPVAEAKKIQLRLHGPDELFVFSDHQATRTVLDNLIDNALKYTPEHGTVDIRLTELEHCNRLEVCDTGIGIAVENLGRIFERFYRVNRDRDRETGGTGLGLAIVKHLCQAVGAEVAVTSEAGDGTCFSVDFPLDVGTDASI